MEIDSLEYTNPERHYNKPVRWKRSSYRGRREVEEKEVMGKLKRKK
jgi:hypothetical protein